ncbi:MAG: thioredoxin fold domain-containing protein [Nitrospirota bacterium]
MKLRIMLAAAAVIAISVCTIVCGGYKGKEAAAAGAGSITWMGFTEGMQKAKETGKPAMVDFYTTWCKYCQLLDKTTYKDPAVIDLVNKNFISIKVNAEGNASVVDKGKKMTEKELATQYKVSGFPTIWFLSSNGEPIAPLPGYMPPDDFKPVLTYVSSGAYKKMQFQEYMNSLKK